MSRSRLARSGSLPRERERGVCKLCTAPSAGYLPTDRFTKAPAAEEGRTALWVPGVPSGFLHLLPGLTRRRKFSKDSRAFHQRLPHAEWSIGRHCPALPGPRGLPRTGRPQWHSGQSREGPCPHASHGARVQRHFADTWSPARSKKTQEVQRSV